MISLADPQFADVEALSPVSGAMCSPTEVPEVDQSIASLHVSIDPIDECRSHFKHVMEGGDALGDMLEDAFVIEVGVCGEPSVLHHSPQKLKKYQRLRVLMSGVWAMCRR